MPLGAGRAGKEEEASTAKEAAAAAAATAAQQPSALLGRVEVRPLEDLPHLPSFRPDEGLPFPVRLARTKQYLPLPHLPS